MRKLTRTARGILIALVLGLLVSAPTAAAQPTRTRIDLTGTGIFSADESGCGFAVSREWLPGSRVTITDFSDGTEVIERRAMATLTNVATGATFLSKYSFHDMSRFDAANGVYRGEESGEFILAFYPGDMGPYGLVQAPGLGLHFDGTVWYAWDVNANATTEFAYSGKIIDVCALLS